MITISDGIVINKCFPWMLITKTDRKYNSLLYFAALIFMLRSHNISSNYLFIKFNVVISLKFLWFLRFLLRNPICRENVTRSYLSARREKNKHFRINLICQVTPTLCFSFADNFSLCVFLSIDVVVKVAVHLNSLSTLTFIIKLLVLSPHGVSES